MIESSENALVIRPTNAKPKGFLLYFSWAMLGLGIVTIPFGIGLLLVLIPIPFLFVLPRKYEKNMPVSMVLYEDRLQTYIWHGKESWSVPWKDIDKVYLVSTHWAMPRNIGLRLHRHDNLKASMDKTRQRTGAFWDKLHALNTSKASMMVGRMICKSEVMIANACLDRPAKEFAELIMSYRHIYLLKNMNMEPSPVQQMMHEALTQSTT